MVNLAREGVWSICDIDFFRTAPVINDKGADWFGTKRLKAPEEYIEGCATKAVSLNKAERYVIFSEFWNEWKEA